MQDHSLHSAFEPGSVAVVGARGLAASTAQRLLRNLASGDYQGQVYAVGAGSGMGGDVPAFASLRDLPRPAELVLVTAPLREVPDLLRQCGEAGTSAVMLISGDPGERISEATDLQDEIRELARAYGINLLGPSRLGLMRPASG